MMIRDSGYFFGPRCRSCMLMTLSAKSRKPYRPTLYVLCTMNTI